MTIDTERLILRPLVPDDFDALRLIHADAELMWVYGGVFDEQRTREWIDRNRKRYADHGFGLFAITLRETGELIGSGGPVWQETDRGTELEVGYQVRRDQWKRGYATETARGSMKYAFENTGVTHVISLIRPENLASRRVAEKNGLSIDREIRWHDFQTLVYQISREKWLAIHG